jgi:hypothetical protein
MEQDSIGTMDRPIRITDDFGASERLADVVDELCDSSARWLGTSIANIEDMIERYPWPALLLGIGIGYLIARRTR